MPTEGWTGPRYREIVQNLPIAFYLLEPVRRDGHVADFTYLDVNRQAELRLRRPRSELVGRRISEVMPLVLGAPVFRELARCSEESTCWESELDLRKWQVSGADWAYIRAFPASGCLAVLSEDITERKRAMRQRELHSALLKNMAEGLCVVRAADASILYTNRKFEQMSAYAPGELVGQDVRVLCPPEQLAAMEEVLADLRSAGQLTFPTVTLCKDGRRLVCRANASTVVDPDHGDVWVIVQEDVTERLRLEEELNGFFEMSIDMLCVAGLDGYFRRLNPAWSRVLGHSQAELLQQPFLHWVHPDDLASTRAETERLSSGGGTLTFRNRYRAHDGSYRSLEWRSAASLDRGLVFAIARDVTEQEQASRIRSQLAAVVEASTEAIVAKSLDGRISSWNAAASALYGYTADEVVGQSVERLLLPEDRVEEERAMLARVAAGERIQALETRRKRKDGTLVDVLASFAPIRGSEGSVVGVAAVIRDDTERRRAQRQIQRSLQEKEVLLREIHHRVKNNLQVISSLLGLQAMHLTDPKVQSLFNETRSRVRAIALLHEKLYRSGNLASISAADYLGDLVSAIRAAQGSGAPVAMEVSAEGICIRIDEAVPCGLIITELVTNALKYAFPPGHVRQPRVRVMFREVGGYIELSVIDSGVGWPADMSQARETLGLSLVRTLARQLRGQLTFGVSEWSGASCVLTYARTS